MLHGYMFSSLQRLIKNVVSALHRHCFSNLYNWTCIGDVLDLYWRCSGEAMEKVRRI